MKIFALLISISLFLSCSTLKVQKVSDVAEIKGDFIVYQLPQNQIDLQIELTKTRFYPGPYTAYSKTYLEVEPLQTKYNEEWQISNVQLKTSLIVDTAQTYLLTGAIDKISESNLLQLIGNDKVKSTVELERYAPQKRIIPFYNEMSLKKLIIEDKKTSYKEVTVDSISKRIPVVNIVVRNKTTEEMAKDAAKTLAKIRKRKFRLIAGLNDSFPKKGDIQIMIDELDKKEQYYLKLFMGRVEEEKKTVFVSVLPTEYKKYNLFLFDKSKGIIDNSLLSEKEPIVLNIQPANSTELIDISSKIKKKESYLPCRNPKMVNISIESNGAVIYESRLPIAQFGKLSYLPINLLKSSEFKIDNSIVEQSNFK